MIFTNERGENQIIVMLGDTEKEIIKQMSVLAIENNGGNVTHAARSLGINRTTLAMRLHEWGIRLRVQMTPGRPPYDLQESE